jgi:hypothetical protein
MFEKASSDKKLLLLLGASHLQNMAGHLNHEKWEIVVLCQTDATVAGLMRKVQDEKKLQEYEDITAVIQLLDNSVFQGLVDLEEHATCHTRIETVPTMWMTSCMWLVSKW